MSETTKKTYTDLKIETKPGSEIEIQGEIPVEFVESFRAKAIRRVKERVELPGFRKGHVPDNMVVAHVGEEALLKEIAEQALGEVYADIVTDHKLEVIGRPAVSITKLAPKNPIGFKIRSAVFPTIELPEYKKIAEKVLKKQDDPEKIVVNDSDVVTELENIRNAIALSKRGAEGEKESAEEEKEPIDDAFAKKLGSFGSLEDLKDKMKQQMLFDKKSKAYDARRLAIVDAVLADCTFEVPGVFTEGELDQMVASFDDRVRRAGMQMDAYLTEVGKTIEDLRKEWRVDAEKRAKLQLVLNEIAQKEGITPDEKKLDREVEHMCEHYPDADERTVRTYVKAQMANELVFGLLEGGKRPFGEHVHDHAHDHVKEEK